MSTFPGSYGSQAMHAAVAMHVDQVQAKGLDVHTITLILSGQSGEFDLVVEATDDDMEDHRFEGVAHRSGGVAGFKEVEAR